MRTMALALVLTVSMMNLGCTKKEGPAGSQEPGRKETGPYMTKFRIGPVVDADGIVTKETDAFKQGESIHISFEVKNVPDGTRIRVLWADSSKREISEEVKPLPSNDAVTFEMKDAGSLAPGAYVVEFSRAEPSAPKGWGGLGVKPFTVSGNPSPSP